ncbi:transglycosylase domain-containing protein, partial [Lysobacter sp. 2RAB21]
AQSPPVPQAAPTSNAEALQQVSYQDQLEPVALLIRISREWPPERMADMVLGTLDYGRDSEGLEQAARTYFGTAVEDLSSPELSMLMAIALRSGNRDPYCYPEQFLENYDEHFDRPWTRALPAISVASSARLKPVDCKKQP